MLYASYTESKYFKTEYFDFYHILIINYLANLFMNHKKCPFSKVSKTCSIVNEICRKFDYIDQVPRFLLGKNVLVYRTIFS